MRAPASASLLLSPGERKQIDLVLGSAPAKKSPSTNAKKSASPSAATNFDDKSTFTVASFIDRIDVAGRGSGTRIFAAVVQLSAEHTTRHINFGRTAR